MAISRRTLLGWSVVAMALDAAPVLAQETHALPRRGDHLPQEVQQAGPIADPASKHLRKPPVGYGWYQIGRAYVMATQKTNQIVEVENS